MSNISSVVLGNQGGRIAVESKKELKSYSSTQEALEAGLLPAGDKPIFIKGTSHFGCWRGILTIYIGEDKIPDDAEGFVYGNRIDQKIHKDDVYPSWGDRYVHYIPIQFYKLDLEKTTEE